MLLTTELNESFQESLFIGSWIITKFQYQYWNGIITPFLSIKQRDSYCYFPFIGPKHLILSKTLFCTSCFQPKSETNWIGWCTSCQTKKSNLQFSCILTRAGDPFGDVCNPSKYALCQDEEFCRKFCQPEYVIYLGHVGTSLKFGITRLHLGHYSKGYYFRILDQGFDSALVFRGLDPLNLASAQNLEDTVAHYFNIPLSLTFDNKLQAFTNQKSVLDTEALHEIASIIEDAFPDLALFDLLNFTSDYWWFHPLFKQNVQLSENISVKRYPSVIAGEILLAKGQLALISCCDVLYWINLYDLQGRSYYQWED